MSAIASILHSRPDALPRELTALKALAAVSKSAYQLRLADHVRCYRHKAGKSQNPANHGILA